MYSYKGLLSQLVKVLSEISTEAPFLAQSLKNSPPPALSLRVLFGTASSLIAPGSQLLNQWVGHVSFLLPPLVYYLSYLTNL